MCIEIIRDVLYCTTIVAVLVIGYLLGKNLNNDDRVDNLAKRIINLQKDNEFLKHQLVNLRENKRLSDEFIDKQQCELAETRILISDLCLSSDYDNAKKNGLNYLNGINKEN